METQERLAVLEAKLAMLERDITITQATIIKVALIIAATVIACVNGASPALTGLLHLIGG